MQQPTYLLHFKYKQINKYGSINSSAVRILKANRTRNFWLSVSCQRQYFPQESRDQARQGSQEQSPRVNSVAPRNTDSEVAKAMLLRHSSTEHSSDVDTR